MGSNFRGSFLASLFLLVAVALNASSIADEYKKISANGKYGLANATTDEVIIAPQFDDIGWSDRSFKIIDGTIGYKENDTWGLINIEGEKVVNAQYTLLYPFTGNLLVAGERSRFSILSKYGVVNTKGKTTVPFDFENVRVWGNHLISVKRINSLKKTGLTAASGKVLIPFEYEVIQPINPRLLAVQEEAGLRAIFDIQGNQISGFEFESINDLDADHYLITYYNRKGIVNSKGSVVVPPVYKQIRSRNGRHEALSFDKWTLLDASNKTIGNYYFDLVLPISENAFAIQANNNAGIITQDESYRGYFPEATAVSSNHKLITIRKGNLKGVVDASGQTILPLDQDSIWINDKVLFARKDNGQGMQWTAFDHAGKKIGYFQYDDLVRETPNRIRARRNNKWGLLDNAGNEVSPFLYDELGELNGVLAKVDYQGRYGVINENGIWVVTPYQDDITLTDDNILYKAGDEFGIMDRDGNVLYTSDNPIQPLGPLLIEKNENDQFVLLNSKGTREVLSAVDTVIHIAPSLYFFKNETRWEVYNQITKATIKLRKEIQLVKGYEEDLMSVMIDDKWGYIDEQGQLNIANRYDSVQHFSEGLSAVKLIGKWGFIDRQERLLIQPNYDEVSPFYGQLSKVRKGASYGLIDKEGKEVLPIRYEHISRNKEYILFEEKGLIGLANKNGVVVRNPQFDSVEPLSKTQFIVSRNGKYGVLSIRGMDIIPVAYDKIIAFDDKFLVQEKASQEFKALK